MASNGSSSIPSDIYRHFLEHFQSTVNINDPLPVKVGSHSIREDEVDGEIVDWTLQYLQQKNCPSKLLAHLVSLILWEVRFCISKDDVDAGINRDKGYEPIKLMQLVTSKINNVCLDYLNNQKFENLCTELSFSNKALHPVSFHAIRNGRRKMEDRHVVIQDLNTICNIRDEVPTSYYAVFDGHAGTDAAFYAASQLHEKLVRNSKFATDPSQALKEAFLATDFSFVTEHENERLKGGTTAVVSLIRGNLLLTAWLGDSQAVLVRDGVATQLVDPHKPDRVDEKERISQLGGEVIFWDGAYRVNGQLAVSRAIGDASYKPYVTAEPDLVSVTLQGVEDFLIIGCDGLWDTVSMEEAAFIVLQYLHHETDISGVSGRLVQAAKQNGSLDNISVIVVFFRDPEVIARRPLPAAPIATTIDSTAPTMEQQQEEYEKLAAKWGWNDSQGAVVFDEQQQFDSSNPFGSNDNTASGSDNWQEQPNTTIPDTFANDETPVEVKWGWKDPEIEALEDEARRDATDHFVATSIVPLDLEEARNEYEKVAAKWDRELEQCQTNGVAPETDPEVKSDFHLSSDGSTWDQTSGTVQPTGVDWNQYDEEISGQPSLIFVGEPEVEQVISPIEDLTETNGLEEAKQHKLWSSNENSVTFDQPAVKEPDFHWNLHAPEFEFQASAERKLSATELLVRSSNDAQLAVLLAAANDDPDEQELEPISPRSDAQAINESKGDGTVDADDSEDEWTFNNYRKTEDSEAADSSSVIEAEADSKTVEVCSQSDCQANDLGNQLERLTVEDNEASSTIPEVVAECDAVPETVNRVEESQPPSQLVDFTQSTEITSTVEALEQVSSTVDVFETVSSTVEELELAPAPVETFEMPSEATPAPAEVVAEPSQPTETIAEPVEVVTESAKVIAEPSQLVELAPELVAAATETPEIVPERSELVEEPTQSVEIPTTLIEEAAQSVEITSKLVEEPSQSVEITSELVEEPIESIVVAPELTLAPTESLEIVAEPVETVEIPSESVEVAPHLVAEPSETVEFAAESIAAPIELVSEPQRIEVESPVSDTGATIGSDSAAVLVTGAAVAAAVAATATVAKSPVAKKPTSAVKKTATTPAKPAPKPAAKGPIKKPEPTTRRAAEKAPADAATKPTRPTKLSPLRKATPATASTSPKLAVKEAASPKPAARPAAPRPAPPKPAPTTVKKTTTTTTTTSSRITTVKRVASAPDAKAGSPTKPITARTTTTTVAPPAKRPASARPASAATSRPAATTTAKSASATMNGDAKPKPTTAPRTPVKPPTLNGTATKTTPAAAKPKPMAAARPAPTKTAAPKASTPAKPTGTKTTPSRPKSAAVAAEPKAE